MNYYIIYYIILIDDILIIIWTINRLGALGIQQYNFERIAQITSIIKKEAVKVALSVNLNLDSLFFMIKSMEAIV